MQAWYHSAFEREMGATATDFRRCLPEAFEPFVTVFGADASIDVGAEQRATIALPTGTASLAWQQLAPRSIGLLASLPRLRVLFDFDGVDEAERQRVMKRFDLVMLRGGG